VGPRVDGAAREVLLSTDGRRATLSCSVLSPSLTWVSGIGTGALVALEKRGLDIVGSSGMSVVALLLSALPVADGREKKEGRPRKPRRRFGEVFSLATVMLLKRGGMLNEGRWGVGGRV
jgi:hypothetical protein